jgi:hypothetical protein
MTLLEIRDELNVARDLVVALYLACSSPILPGGERQALCTLANSVRDRLDTIGSAMDRQIRGEP